MTSLRQERDSNRLTERDRIGTLTSPAKDLTAIGLGDHGIQVQISLVHFCQRADGYLATATHTVKQRAFARRSHPGFSVIEESQMLPHDGINSADFNCQRTLTCRRAHDLRRQYLTNQMLFSQSNQARGGKNDGGVFAGFEFAKPGINVSPQRMNL